MPKNPWLTVLVVLTVLGGGYAVLDRTVLDDDREPKIKVSTPADPVGSGADEPSATRVYVDHTGQRSSVAIRTPKSPWKRSLVVKVNASTTTLERGARLDVRTTPKPAAGCQPTAEAEPTSLLTRVSWPTECLGDAHGYDVTVTVDGGKPTKASAQPAAKPNVLFIMVDDMRADELQWMPNVQKLIAKEGVTFTNGFSGYPLCCPARASVLTGELPHNHGVWSHEPPWGFSALQDQSTFPVWLQDQGYHTTYLGKYLNGYGDDPEPGKDSGTSTQYVPPGWDLWRASIDGGLEPTDPDDGGTYRYWDTTLNDNGDGYVSLQGQYQTRAYARLTRETLADAAADEKPFMSYVSFTAPHHGGPGESDDPDEIVTPARPQGIRGQFDDLITEAPGADWKDPDRSDKPKRMKRKPPSDDLREQMLEGVRQRAEALYIVDQSVKRIINGLRETGELDNTLVLFTSDNGYFQGEQGERQGKVLPYEPSLRVPLVMRGPGIPAGEVRTDPFLSIDHAPTLADLADATPPEGQVDGRSLLDVARLGDESAGASWSRVVLTETKPTNAAQSALEAVDPVGARQTETMVGKVTGIRTGRYLYTEWQPEPGDPKPGILVELYDVLADPDQYVNLAVQPGHEALLAEFHQVLAKARTCRADTCRELLPPDLR